MIELRYRVAPTKLDTLELDLTLREGHDRSADVTDHPIEDSLDVTDHVKLKAQRYTIEGLITNTPFDKTPDGGITQAAFDALDALVGRVVTVRTRFKVYENMVLEQLSIPRDKTGGESLRFTGSFKQIRKVSNLTATIGVDVPDAPTKKKLGPKVATDAYEKAKAANAARINRWSNTSSSVLRGIVGGL